jgi:copper(I)-binding protein
MNRRHLLATAALLLAAATNAVAHDFKAGPISIDHPWARPTAAGQSVGGGFLKLTNGGAADRLVAASTAVSATVELHSMRMEGDVMRMRQVDAIDLPAGGSVELKPGGLHLMLMGLKQPLKAGDTFPLKLRFEKAGEVVVTVNVETPKPAEPAAAHKH